MRDREASPGASSDRLGREIVAITIDENIRRMPLYGRETCAATRIIVAGSASSACTACCPRSRPGRSRSRSTSSSRSTCAAAGESDDLDDTVDYSAVCEAVSRVVRNERYQLLERLATRIAEVCSVRRPGHRCARHGAQAAPAGAGHARPRRRARRAVTLRARTSGSAPTSVTGWPRSSSARSTTSPRTPGITIGGGVAGVRDRARRRAGAGRLPERGRRRRHRSRRTCPARARAASRGARRGACARERWGPRTLDVDVLLVGDVHVDEPDLEIPHPRL